VLQKNLAFEHFRYTAEILAACDDLLALYEIFVETGRQLRGALLGLNRIYLPTPDHLKSVDETISLMAIKPPALSERLKSSFRIAGGSDRMDQPDALIIPRPARDDFSPKTAGFSARDTDREVAKNAISRDP
jgi:hypothetical protein